MRFSSVDSTPTDSRRLAIVPPLSSAARIPFPSATRARAVSWSPSTVREYRGCRPRNRPRTAVRLRMLGGVQDVFAPGGALSRALPGFEPRTEQAALAAAVELALSAGDHLVAEAGTGTGKSLAYLIPALESG